MARQVADGLFDLLRRAEADDALRQAQGADAQAGADALSAEESADALAQLSAIGGADLDGYVRRLLDSGDGADALLAARLLPESAGAELKQAVAERMVALAESTAQRRVAAAALGHISTADAATVAALHAGLEDADAGARTEAVRALARLQAVDEVSLAKLRRLYHADAEDGPRHAALHALLALGRAADVGMIHVPAGEFLMGSAGNDKDAEDDEKPQHRLHLPDYFFDRTPVTNAQFRGFVEAGGYAHGDYWAEAIEAQRWRNGLYVDYDGEERRQPWLWNDAKWNGDEQPVVGVSWYEALAYARWAGKRLPSEAEWEKAARWDAEQGRSLIYPWRDGWADGRANTKEAGIGRTTPVGQFSPGGDSPIGVVDMTGNVWEWCSTRWGYDYPYVVTDGREDLSGGDDVTRVLRGGSWANDRQWGRCARRNWASPWNGRWHRGLRCVCATSSPLLDPDS